MGTSDHNLRVTFVLPVLNETFSLRKTVDYILELCRDQAHELLIVIAEKTTQESLSVIYDLQRTYGSLVRIHKQELPLLGGALREAFEIATGEYVMLMASDLETDPSILPEFIERMKEGCWDIVASSRWLDRGGFEGYGFIKLVLNYIFQKIFGLLYGKKLTDLTYAYRLYRKSILEGIVWEELKHPFLLECLLKPLRRGARVTEVACKWRARSEGDSANSFIQMFSYLRIAFKVRLFPIYWLY